MGKLKELTVEQEDLMGSICKEYKDKFYLCPGINIDKAEKAIESMYVMLGRSKPKIVYAFSLYDATKLDKGEYRDRNVGCKFISTDICGGVIQQLLNKVSCKLYNRVYEKMCGELYDSWYSYNYWYAISSFFEFWGKMGIFGNNTNALKKFYEFKDIYLESGIYKMMAKEGVCIVIPFPKYINENKNRTTNTAVEWMDGTSEIEIITEDLFQMANFNDFYDDGVCVIINVEELGGWTVVCGAESSLGDSISELQDMEINKIMLAYRKEEEDEKCAYAVAAPVRYDDCDDSEAIKFSEIVGRHNGSLRPDGYSVPGWVIFESE